VEILWVSKIRLAWLAVISGRGLAWPRGVTAPRFCFALLPQRSQLSFLLTTYHWVPIILMSTSAFRARVQKLQTSCSELRGSALAPVTMTLTPISLRKGILALVLRTLIEPGGAAPMSLPRRTFISTTAVAATCWSAAKTTAMTTISATTARIATTIPIAATATTITIAVELLLLVTTTTTQTNCGPPKHVGGCRPAADFDCNIIQL